MALHYQVGIPDQDVADRAVRAALEINEPKLGQDTDTARPSMLRSLASWKAAEELQDAVRKVMAGEQSG